MGSATGVDIPPRTRAFGSRRLLRLVGDDRLVQQIRRGNEAAFEVAFERHAPPILGYCRHMLGSPEEAEDAVQQTFAAAYGDLQRGGEREIALKPWLFTIARNRCLSMLRARREHALAEPELVTAGLAEQVERRAELRQLLADVRELPDEQRDALLLAEVGGLPQVEIAAVLGCEVARVKGLVYRARSALIARRDARELPCERVREQLATLRGGSLRRAELRLHVRDCPGCRAFREDVRRQRKLMSVALPVVPTLGLKTSVLAAAGVGAGSAGGGGAAAAGLIGGGSAVAKLAVAGTLVVGGGTAAVVAERHSEPAPRPDPVTTTRDAEPAAEAPLVAPRSAAPREPMQAAPRAGEGRGRALGKERGRGPIAGPPAQTPVRRGPPQDRGKPEHAGPPSQARGQRGGPPPQARAQGGGAPPQARARAGAPPQARARAGAPPQARARGEAQGLAGAREAPSGKAKGQAKEKPEPNG
jgi:RNA polymerase sigma factor (sigma-70 family)